MEGEQFIQYNPGVAEFIKNMDTRNYIVSGRLREFLQNIKIANWILVLIEIVDYKNKN